MADVTAFMRTGQPRQQIEREFATHRSTRAFAVHLKAMLDVSGKFEGTTVVLFDVTELRRAERERERVIAQLSTALGEVRTLTGLLPICAWCKKVRDDKGYWSQLEAFISSHTAAEFSHGICPQCNERLELDLKNETQAGR